jgi:hypothetical protein
MATRLSEALRDEAGPIVDELFRALRSSAHTPHYRGAGEDLLRRRCEALMAAFVATCEGDPDAFGEHVRRITEERIAEGYYLQEMQRALSVLEAAAWHVVVDRSNVLNLVHHLSVITSVIGRAKDELASAFLADATRNREMLRRLSEGTDAHVQADDESPPARPIDRHAS